MKTCRQYKIHACLSVFMCFFVSTSVYALEPGMAKKTEMNSIPVISADKPQPDKTTDPTITTNTSIDFQMQTATALPLPAQPYHGSVVIDMILKSYEKMDSQQLSQFVDSTVKMMAAKGYEAEMSIALDLIEKSDYKGLVVFQKNNPEFFLALINIMNDTPIGKKDDPKNDLISGTQEDPSKEDLEKIEKLYYPFQKRLEEIRRGLEKSALQTPADFLKNTGETAKDLIVNSYDQAKANLADNLLSRPLESTAYAADAVAGTMPNDEMNGRKLTAAEIFVESSIKLQVIDSVYVGKDFINTHRLLYPPRNLHPYLKWLLYTRNLNSRMVKNYLKTRDSVIDLFNKAKEGQGNIRYRGHVYGAFLPYAETAAGNYELVKPASE